MKSWCDVCVQLERRSGCSGAANSRHSARPAPRSRSGASPPALPPHELADARGCARPPGGGQRAVGAAARGVGHELLVAGAVTRPHAPPPVRVEPVEAQRALAREVHLARGRVVLPQLLVRGHVARRQLERLEGAMEREALSAALMLSTCARVDLVVAAACRHCDELHGNGGDELGEATFRPQRVAEAVC